MTKFKVGDCICHSSGGKRYTVNYVGKTEYRLSDHRSSHIYLKFIHEGPFRLCDELIVDLILDKYSNEM